MSAADRASAMSALFERLLAEAEGAARPELRVDEALRALPGADGPPEPGGSAAETRAVVARAIDLYADLLRETFGLYADLVDGVLRAPAAGAGVSAAGGVPAVTLAARPGARAAAPVWVHNGGEAPLHAVALRATDLAAHDGATVAGRRAGFSPAVLDVAPGASASSTLAVEVPPGAAPGAYHGLVLASGVPRASVPVLLVVE